MAGGAGSGHRQNSIFVIAHAPTVFADDDRIACPWGPVSKGRCGRSDLANTIVWSYEDAVATRRYLCLSEKSM